MKNITKLVTGLTFLGLVGLGTPNYIQAQTYIKTQKNYLKAQNQTKEQTQETNPWFDKKYKMYFEIEKAEDMGGTSFTSPLVPTKFYKELRAWLTSFPKEYKSGDIWLYYNDLNDDGFYEYIYNVKYEGPITIIEKFRFYSKTEKIEEKIDYTLDFREFETGFPADEQKQILEKKYKEITQKEAYDIGEDFVKRAMDLLNVQDEFSRFNPDPLDSLIREEKYQWEVGWKEGKKKFTRTGFPIYKHFSEQEIKKLEDFLNK